MNTLSTLMGLSSTGKGTQIGCCECTHRVLLVLTEGTVRARLGLAGRSHMEQSCELAVGVKCGMLKTAVLCL
jgi:hypothetical protein